MPEPQKQIHFSPLDELETLGKYRLSVKEPSVFKCWTKGDSARHQFVVTYLYENKLLIELKAQGPIPPTFRGNVLFSFEVGGVQFFSTGTLVTDTRKDVFSLNLPKTVFKCERRTNYRLGVYPNKDVRCYFDLKKMKRLKGGTVVSLQKKDEKQDEVLDSFANLVKTVNGVGANQYVMCLRVEDVSVSGLALHVGILESDYFEKGHEIEKFLFIFDKKQYEIPKAKVAYMIDHKDPKKAGVKMFKVGLQFSGLTEAMDADLSAQIAKELRNVDLGKDFEDFIK